jgi:5-carboxymethyl-2-hydroxymuconate isomerase
MLNFCGIVVAILKMETGRNFSMSGINSEHHNLPTYEMALKSDNVELCGIVEAILKMATGRNISMSGINSGHHNLPTYEMALKSDNVEFVRYCGGHFENGDR